MPHRRILLAEDNQLNQVVACEFLERLGLEVSVAENGQEALDTVRSHPPGHFAAILMDLHMPEMDGLQATRLIRALPGMAHTPIIAMTAAALSEDREACLAAGMVAHLSKPVMPDQLRAVLAHWLSDAAQVPSVQEPASQETTSLDTSLHEPTPPPTVNRTACNESLPGFDLCGFRKRLLGNEALMWRLLGKFTELEAHTGDHMATLVAQGATDATRKEVHRLKGCAANLGALTITQTCEQIEAELAQHGAVSAQSLADLQQALAQGLATIRSRLAERETLASQPP